MVWKERLQTRLALSGLAAAENGVGGGVAHIEGLGPMWPVRW